MAITEEELPELIEKLMEDPPIGLSMLSKEETQFIRELVLDYRKELLQVAEWRRTLNSISRLVKQVRERLDMILVLVVGALASQNEDVKGFLEWLGGLISSP